MEEKPIWTVKLDWSIILNGLNLESIEFIPEHKIRLAVAIITKNYGMDDLMNREPKLLDKLVMCELEKLIKTDIKKVIKLIHRRR